LLRLLQSLCALIRLPSKIQQTHKYTQSVAATGGVYKGQGRNRCTLMTCVY